MERVCPLLGLSLDRRVAVEVVDDGHRCHAEHPPSPLGRRQQAQLCLTSRHEQCPLYLSHLSRAGLSDPSWRTGLADGLVSTRLVLTPEPSWRGVAGREARGRHAPWVAMAAAAAAVATGIGGMALAGAMMDGRIALGGLVASPSASPDPATPAATQSPSSQPTSSPAPTASPSPIPSPSPVPTAVPTPAPTAAPQRTYTVQEGDTLAAIAQQFGTTVRALQDANGIEDPNRITIGQVLTVP